MLYLDTETCGLNGFIVTIQWLKTGSVPKFYEVWRQPVHQTLRLLEWICKQDVCAWNLAYDWFHANKLYNIWRTLPDRKWPDPELVMKREIDLCTRNLHAQWCLKPKGALDLWSYARTGPLQSMMIPRKENIIIRKVPEQVATKLIRLLPQPGTDISWIYFAKTTQPQWKIAPCKPHRPGFIDVKLSFNPTTALKPIMRYLFPDEQDSVIDFPVPDWMMPKKADDPGWKPWGGPWYQYIKHQIDWWHHSKKARQYALNDVLYLPRLYELWGCPPIDDTNSQLTVAVGCCHWKGFALDVPRIQRHVRILQSTKDSAPGSPTEARRFILGSEAGFLQNATLNATDETTVRTFIDNNKGTDYARRAEAVLASRSAANRINTLGKLEKSGRFYASFIVVGTKSDRMAGTGQLNAQGIPHDASIRSCFTCHDPGFSFSGGDYSGFEVSIADAVYQDETLHRNLMEGKKIHGLFGSALYNMSYEDILQDQEKYRKAKASVFAGIFYGATEQRTATTAGISIEETHRALGEFQGRHPGIKKRRDEIKELFCSITQPGGSGTKVLWKEPANVIRSLLDHPRFYHLENFFIQRIYQLALSVPKDWDDGTTVTRREDYSQTIPGACRSALFGCAMQLQARNLRTAANHEIQATGGGICKKLQSSLWELQAPGVHPYRIMVFNVHDEVLTVHKPDLTLEIGAIIVQHLKEYRKIVPLLKLDWKWNVSDWSQVK